MAENWSVSTCWSLVAGDFSGLRKRLETETLDSRERMPPKMSLTLINYFLVLGSVNVVITIPTANESVAKS